MVRSQEKKKEQKLGKKCSYKISFQVGMDLKKCRNKAEIKDCKKTALHLLCIFCRCQVVFLHSFIAALFLYLFQVHPYLKSSTQKHFFLIHSWSSTALAFFLVCIPVLLPGPIWLVWLLLRVRCMYVQSSSAWLPDPLRHPITLNLDFPNLKIWKHSYWNIHVLLPVKYSDHAVNTSC